MVDTDWKQILVLSQKELSRVDKEKLCESLSWMEADDIELNFSDLKTLFRLAQDILKYKNEQVNNLMGKLDTAQRKTSRKKSYDGSSPHSSDAVSEVIAHQEEIIKTNKDIIEQLYADIAELEENKAQSLKVRNEGKDSDSSRDPLSEIAAVEQLEGDIVNKNRHIRKLLTDIKICEEENSHLKIKTLTLKEKLSEATQVIEHFTDQVFTLNSDCSKLKDALGKSQENNSQLLAEIDNLKQRISELEFERNTNVSGLRNKLLHWKNSVRSKKVENEALSNENAELKDIINRMKINSVSSKSDHNIQDERTKLLQEKLSDATKEITQSARVIELLRKEINMLRVQTKETLNQSIVFDIKNENNEGKEEALLIKLKRMVNALNIDLRKAEDIIHLREKELTETKSDIQLLRLGEENIAALVDNLKSVKRQLKLKDQNVRSYVQEINRLSDVIDNLQLQNETMRQKLNIEPNTKVPVQGLLKKFSSIETNSEALKKKVLQLENKNINLNLENRKCNELIKILKEKLFQLGYNEDYIDAMLKDENDHDEIGAGGDNVPVKCNNKSTIDTNVQNNYEEQIKELSEENEGLRKGLQEILDYLKENGASASGTLDLQCPTLETVLRSMEARHSAGWFAPHMAAIIELRAAVGGRDALLSALHDARKETFEVMSKLKKETEKSLELEGKLRVFESESEILKETEEKLDDIDLNFGVFGSWMTVEENIKDIPDENEVNDLIKNKNLHYEAQLKISLEYFHKKFKCLYQRMTELAIQATDDQNKLSLQEENCRAEIETLKAQLIHKDDESNSDVSPGAIEFYTDLTILQRKCAYLEESYKYIRTLNENIKNEYVDYKRQAMILCAEYEDKIQTLIIHITNLFNKIRCSISIDLYFKQNEALHYVTGKYKKLLEQKILKEFDYSNLFKKLQDDRTTCLSVYQFETENGKALKKDENSNHNIEYTLIKSQLETVCRALDEAYIKINNLESINEIIQVDQSKIIDHSLASLTKNEVDSLKEQLNNITIEFNAQKKKCQHMSSQLEIALLQLQDQQHKQINNDMEINMLRHQILDLQSTGDNKAIVARLSGEILISHLQASDNYKKIEKLQTALNKEKQYRFETEETLSSREKIFDVYAARYENKFRYMIEVMNILRQQYNGSLPLVSLENYIENLDILSKKNQAVEEKLNEVEDLRAILLAKHDVFDEMLKASKAKCLVDEEMCSHRLQYTINEATRANEISHYNKKIEMLEQSRKDLVARCNSLEKTLIIFNQNYNNTPINNIVTQKPVDIGKEIQQLELQDIQSDDEEISRRSQTLTLTNPQILTIPNKEINTSNVCRNNVTSSLPGSPLKIECSKQRSTAKTVNVFIQTLPTVVSKIHQITQTEEDKELQKLKHSISEVKKDNDFKNKEITEALSIANQRSNEIINLKAYALVLETKLNYNETLMSQKEEVNTQLQKSLIELNNKLSELQKSEKGKDENKSLLAALNKLQEDNKKIIEEYKEILTGERDEYANNMKDAQRKILNLQAELNRNSSELSNTDAVKEVVNKYTVKIVELEDEIFRLQNDLDGTKVEMATCKKESDRWKTLAAERLTKMEKMNGQFEEKHFHEVQSYKSENEHWLVQLNECQREQMELRSRLTEQRAVHVKQLVEKDSHIEQMRNVIQNLKSQIMNMQTLISVNDPSFDLSAIIEVDENCDVLSQQGSERLEIKFDSTLELQDFQDDLISKPFATSTAIWQEPLIERLRREKQLIGKQNNILRRQIKALAGRERRARLEAQNLKNQVYRINTSGTKVSTAETTALHNKISSLQAQLANARRDTQSSVSLWDKWKR